MDFLREGGCSHTLALDVTVKFRKKGYQLKAYSEFFKMWIFGTLFLMHNENLAIGE